MKAKWDILTQDDGGILVIYRNFITDLVFECGICKPGTPLDLIIEYIEEEGDAGDQIFHDGRWLTHLITPVLA